MLSETRTSSRKRMQDRLAGAARHKPKKDAPDILRRGALGKPDGIAEAIVGKLKFIPRLQTLLDQSDLDWSASQTMLNLAGGALVALVGLLVLGYNMLIAIGCGETASISVRIRPLMQSEFLSRT